ncbi:MAG: uracil-DNA glycosylase [Acidobacteria bacterium]|nr:uracil-DNA glycosylase [Acidobacteriota bacterium]
MSNDNLLFGDLFDGEPREWVERVDIPSDDSLEKILSDVKLSHTCGACKKGMPIIFGEGFVGVNVMVIGEGPGVDDIGSERPFMGQAGVLLDRMLAAIELRRAECYVCNVIKCIPPGERNFSVEEIEDCRPYLLRQILVVDPRVIIAFGALAAQTLLRSKRTISELRGRVYHYSLNDRAISVVPTFNPAYLLRVPEKKRQSWEDMKLVRGLLTR